MVKPYDVIIIGAGSAGLSAQRQVARHTDNYILVQDGPYGTSCARVACMPTKALLEAAHAVKRREFLRLIGTAGVEGLSVDVGRVLQHVRNLRDRFVRGMVKSTEELGARVVAGRARFVDADTIDVSGKRIRGARIIVATGSRPIIPEPWQTLRNRILTTDEFFEQEDLPPRMAVIGLGPAGLEFAQALAWLGIETVGFDRQSYVGGLSDPFVNKAALEAIRKDLPLHMDQDVRLREREDGVSVECAAGTFHVDKVLLTIGRRPNLDNMGWEALKVDLNDDGVPLCDPGTLRVYSLPVYIAGDANGARAVLHEAVYEGQIAGSNAVRDTDRRFDRPPELAIVFTRPQIARVGPGFHEIVGSHVRDLKQKPERRPEHTPFVVGEYDFADQSRARMADENHGLIRVYAERKTGRLMGAQMAAPAGEHMAHLLSWAGSANLSVVDMPGYPFYHPTIEEGLRTALHDAARQTENYVSPLEGHASE